MGDEIDGAMQHAPQPTRQSMTALYRATALPQPESFYKTN
jgi:hypothetical protein